jgi:PAS domain S-box-containing protein
MTTAMLDRALDDIALRAHSRSVGRASLLLDADFVIRWASENCSTLFGHHIDDLVGRTSTELVHPDDLGLVLEILTYEMQADTSQRAELPSRSTRLLRVLDQRGEPHWMEAYLSNFLTDPEIGLILVDLEVPSQFRHTDDALAASQTGAPIEEVLGLVLRRLTDGQPGQSAAAIFDRAGTPLVSSGNVSAVAAVAGGTTWDLALTPDVSVPPNGTLRVWSPYTPAHPIDMENADKVARYAALVIAQREMLGALEKAALHDPLTGVANRRALETTLDERCQAGHSTLVAYLDLDGFKAINDNFGHGVGDQVLATVADRLRSALRPEDVVARVLDRRGRSGFAATRRRHRHAGAQVYSRSRSLSARSVSRDADGSVGQGDRCGADGELAQPVDDRNDSDTRSGRNVEEPVVEHERVGHVAVEIAG